MGVDRQRVGVVARRRHGPALPAVPPSQQRAAAALPYHPLLRRARVGQPLAKAPFSARPEPPPQAPEQAPGARGEPGRPERKDAYRPWAELLARSFAVDV